MPQRTKPPTYRQENIVNPQQQKQQQTRRVRHIKEQQPEEKGDSEEETVDSAAALHIKELMGDWSSVNIVRPILFKEKNPVNQQRSAKRTLGQNKLPQQKHRLPSRHWITKIFYAKSTARSIVTKH